VLCKAFKAKIAKGEFPNLTVKKIPKAVLARCEWDKDDYSLEIKALPTVQAEPDPEPTPEKSKTKGAAKSGRRRAAAAASGDAQRDLFQQGGK
jgi:adenine-specific DNA-methyltransferase